MDHPCHITAFSSALREYKEGDSLQDPRVASSIAIHFAAVNRNIRCVLAYLYVTCSYSHCIYHVSMLNLWRVI
eukprot:m.54329 g.54329  ORF g.54329 m.54329 type:complete len:73 (+) comp11408_c1_seq4:176-394(+)